MRRSINLSLSLSLAMTRQGNSGPGTIKSGPGTIKDASGTMGNKGSYEFLVIRITNMLLCLRRSYGARVVVAPVSLKMDSFFANTGTVRLLAKEHPLFGQRSEFLRF